MKRRTQEKFCIYVSEDCLNSFCTFWVRLSILITTGVLWWTCLCVSHICSRITSLSAALIVLSDPSCMGGQCNKQSSTSACWNRTEVLLEWLHVLAKAAMSKQLTQKLKQIQQTCLKDSWAWSQWKGLIDMEYESSFVETEIWQRLFTQGTPFNFPS